ncbi:MAG: hypothetical protein ABIE94_04135 [archaeon]
MKHLVFILAFLLAIGSSYAANLGVVVEFPAGTIHQECISVPENTDGYEALQETSLDIGWSDDSLFGHALCNIEGVGDNVVGTGCAWGSEYWGFFIANNNDWQYSPVGFDGPGNCWNNDVNSWDGHYCARQGDVIGLSYGSYGTEPTFFPYDEICENKLKFKDVKIYVDDDKSSADEDGGRITDVKPGSVIEIKIEIENLFTDEEDIDINNIEVSAIIYDIDDGDNLDDDASDFDLGPEKDETVNLRFKIPYDAEEDTYDLLLTAEGTDDNGVEHKAEIEYDLRIKKEDEEAVIKNLELSPQVIECGRTSSLEVELINTGEDDLEVSIQMSNEELNLFETRNPKLGEGDTRSYSFEISTSGADNKIYPIKVFFDFGYETRTEILDLEIFGCEEEVKQGNVEGTNTYTNPPEGTFIATGFASKEVEEDFFNTIGWYVLLIVLAIIAIVIGIIMIYRL